MSHFGLSREDVLSAAALSDEDAAKWFLSHVPDCARRIMEWNRIALNLGRPGYPLAEHFRVALATTYKHVDSHDLTTVFEVLEADEKDT
jgi:hypothetical protein